MKILVDDYEKNLYQLIGGWYWRGCYGQIGTETLWKQKSTQSASMAIWYTSHYSAKAKGLGKHVDDCVGIDKYSRWVLPSGYVPYDADTDLSEAMLFQKAKDDGCEWGEISTIPKSRRMIVVTYPGHMGIATGDGRVFEARGGAYGNVFTNLAERPWTFWYENPFIDYGDEKMIICKKGDKDSVTLTQNVISMQKAIVRLGYKMENNGVIYAPDGSYGTATANGLLSFMKANGLAGNGETFDDKINAVLLIKLSELEDYKSELAIANAKIAELTKQINSANAQIAILKQQLSAEQAKNTELTNKLVLSQAQVASLNTQLIEVTKDRDAKLADLTEIARANDIIEKY